jgi:hypothetical protein
MAYQYSQNSMSPRIKNMGTVVILSKVPCTLSCSRSSFEAAQNPTGVRVLLRLKKIKASCG